MQLQTFQAQEAERASPGPRKQIESEAEELQGVPQPPLFPIRVFTGLGRL